MADTLADLMVEMLKASEVLRVYGIPGDPLNGFTDALRRDGGIPWDDVRRKEATGFAAATEAALTGELAVCAGSYGPGNFHLINGSFDANGTVRLPRCGSVQAVSRPYNQTFRVVEQSTLSA